MICRSCDKINVLCDKFCDKNEARNFIGRDKVPLFRVKGKRKAQSRSLGNCHDKVFFSAIENQHFLLELF